MATHTAYVSGLRPDFDPRVLLKSIDLGANSEEIVNNVETDGKGAAFLIFTDDRFVELCMRKYNGGTVLGCQVQVSRPTAAQIEQLVRLNPTVFETDVKQTLQRPTDDSVAVKAVLDAISGLSNVQRDMLRNALTPPLMATDNPQDGTRQKSAPVLNGATCPPPGFNSSMVGMGPQIEHQPRFHTNTATRFEMTRPPAPSQLPRPVQTSAYGHQQHYSGMQLQSTPNQVGQPSFHFGLPSTAHSVRVSTFSGSPHDCSFEQFRYDVQCLINQGAAEGIILLAIKRAIKGQAQEIALHMGETATVTDILNRFEMMFGDVNPPHVLLAQFYAAEQRQGENITDYYSRMEDIASRIIKKDSTVIRPNNYDVIVNTQFWTKMHDQRIKNALRHKFDLLSGSPQFIIEARKIESECQAETVRIHTCPMLVFLPR